MIDAFVYCWTDHLTNKLYVGSHKGTTDDGYICSSKLMMEEYKKRPYDFTRQIVAEGIFDDIRKLEAKILDSADVRNDPMFYNQHNGNGDFHLKGHTEEYKKSQSILLTGKKKSDTSKMGRYERTPEIRKRLSESKIGIKRPMSAETKIKLRISIKEYNVRTGGHQLGTKRNQRTKDAISKANSKEWYLTYPDGKSEIISNLTKFCKEHKLSLRQMYKLSKGGYLSYKGYQVSKA